MSGILAFLAARHDEDEQTAIRLQQWADGDSFGACLVDPVIGPFGGQSRHRHVGVGIDLNRVADPGRLLRAVAAKRKVIAETLHHMEWIDGERGDCHNAESIAAGRCEDLLPEDEPAFRAMASEYNDHPDYQVAWGEPLPD